MFCEQKEAQKKKKQKAGFKLDFSQETDGEKKMKIQW
jgi:hypothetical protein